MRSIIRPTVEFLLRNWVTNRAFINNLKINISSKLKSLFTKENRDQKLIIDLKLKEFKLKQLLVKHCGIAHGYFAKPQTPVGQNNQRPQPIRNRTAFYLYTTPMTKAARFVCTNTIKLNKLARKPFKLVELSDLNKECKFICDLIKMFFL